jgi:hypothetical protein
MFEGLIDFIEQTVFTLVNQITKAEPGPLESGAEQGAYQAQRVVAMVIHFAEKNPGMARVMVGDALVHENERLQQQLRQSRRQSRRQGQRIKLVVIIIINILIFRTRQQRHHCQNQNQNQNLEKSLKNVMKK